MQNDLTPLRQLTPEHIQQLVDLYQEEWWTKGRLKSDVEVMLSGPSLVFAYADKHSNLAAFARVITDEVYKALIFDVIVRADLRCIGFGSVIINDIKKHPRLRFVKHLELYCKPELMPFYEQHGFMNLSNNVVLMRMENRS